MKNRKIVSFLGTAVVTASLLMSLSMPAMAAGDYSDVIGGTKTTKFEKYLVMDSQANVPKAEFTYAVTAGAATTYTVDGKTFQILAGVDADKVTMAGVGTTTANTIAYAPTDTAAQDENANVKDYDKATEKYAKKEATLDFSACKFTEPGIYRYVITESGTNQAVTNDEDSTRIVDVYVDDASTATEKKLEVKGFVMYSGSGETSVDTKSQGFTNAYDTSDLTIRKEVSGTQASHNKYFKFTVKLTNAVADTVYTVDLTGAEATIAADGTNPERTNPATLTADADGNVTATFWLQHGQEIKIQGIAKDTTYEVTEDADGYESTAAGVANYNDATNGTVASTDLKTSYLNTKDGMIPTGVIMTVAPFAAVTLIGGIGAAAMLMKKGKSEDEAE